jgi:hypothetical protein
MVASENAVVVARDALEQGPPRLGMTLTTVDPQYRADEFRRSVEQVMRAVRRVGGPDVGYLGQMEWTTGQGRRSGGARRAHVHVLLRRLAAEVAPDLEERVRRVWLGRTGADRVELRELRTAAGATAYLVLHHRKREQAPPEGLRVTRFRPSANYFDRPVSELRVEARAVLRDRRVRRAAHRALDWDELSGYSESDVDDELRLAIAAARVEASGVRFVRRNAVFGWVSDETDAERRVRSRREARALLDVESVFGPVRVAA